MNISIEYEKLFFKWIEQNPEYYKQIPAYYFENKEISDVYNITKKLILKSQNEDVSLFQVKMELQQNGIFLEDDFINKLFNFDNNDINNIDPEWIQNKFKGWIIKKKSEHLLLKLVEDWNNNQDNIDLEPNIEYLSKLKKEIDNIDLNFLNNKKLCLDFDIIEDHIQPPSVEKISTGYPEFDIFMEGGFAPQTVHLLVGRTNIGKSIFLQNFAINAYNAGYNVLILSLEMADYSIMKRLGCMSLDISSQDYNNLTTDELEKKIKNLNKIKGFGYSENTRGKLLTKTEPASSCTLNKAKDILKEIEDEYKLRINFLVVDYFNLIPSENKQAGLYEKGKEVIEGLRSMAQELNIAVLTATQVTKDTLKNAKAGTKDQKKTNISLGDISESKAVPDTVDSIWAIEQDSDQRKNGLYELNNLKNRSGRLADKPVRVYYNTNTLRINNMVFNYDENDPPYIQMT